MFEQRIVSRIRLVPFECENDSFSFIANSDSDHYDCSNESNQFLRLSIKQEIIKMLFIISIFRVQSD